MNLIFNNYFCLVIISSFCIQFTQSFLFPVGISEPRMIKSLCHNNKDNVNSLEPWLISSIRLCFRYIPIPIFRVSSEIYRIAWLYGGRGSSKIDVISNINSLVFALSSKVEYDSADSKGKNIIIYLQGGGFAFKDNADIFIAERLLPMLAARGIPKPKMHSILYPLTVIKEDDSKLMLVLNQVIATFDQIIDDELISNESTSLPKKLYITIIGDSAGGNLALNLLYSIQDGKSKHSEFLKSKVVSLRSCLISPWVDLFSYSFSPSYIMNQNLDILDIAAIQNAKYRYIVNCPNLDIISSLMIDYEYKLASEIFVKEVISHGVKAVIFDMDQCLVNAHSRGRLHRSELDYFLSKITKDFKYVTEALSRHNIRMAIATFSDSFEYHPLWKKKEDYIIGDDLVQAVLSSISPNIGNSIPYYAYNPNVRKDRDKCNQHKKKHLRVLSAILNVRQQECILFDDDQDNVRDTDGQFTAYAVSPWIGFNLQTAIASIRKSPPICSPYNQTPVDALSSLLSKYESVARDIEELLPTETVTQSEMAEVPYGATAITQPQLYHISPLLASKEMLAALPECLIIAGSNEVFFEDILLFSERLKNAQMKSNQLNVINKLSVDRTVEAGCKSRFLIMKNEVHDYPMFWKHPAYRLLGILRLTWLFEKLFPYRRPEVQCYDYRSGYDHKDKQQASELPPVHSYNADAAICEIADFILKC